MPSLKDRIDSGDAVGASRLSQRISAALVLKSYRRDAAEWEVDEDPDGHTTSSPLPTSEAGGRPYFEVLWVVPSPPAKWPQVAQQIRRLRRPQDQFVYEPVIVGNFEDAVLATLANTHLEAVVIHEGFAWASVKQMPLLRTVLEKAAGVDASSLPVGDFGLALTRAIKTIRPELDVYLLDDCRPEDVVFDPAASGLRRVVLPGRGTARDPPFDPRGRRRALPHSVLRQPQEVCAEACRHVPRTSEGVDERFRTPFFDNLKKYAQKPVGTFHALPVARGKSIFKSEWIRDMGEFYGPTLFLAESSATTGGLDSLLEPTGTIKEAQEAAARAFGADQVFFVTNGTSTSNKMVYQALCQPGDIVIVDRNCHKSHHYGMVLAGAEPYYVDAFPLTAYSMYGSVPLRTIKRALLNLKAAGRLDKVRMIALTNVTFDGHMYDTRRVMEECLAIKPDLVFLWDEAWFGFARFNWLYRPRTAMGARNALQQSFADPKSLEAYLEQERVFGGDLDPTDERLLDTRLVPDPRVAKIRVYQTNSTHKSMSALRQGSMILVGDEDFHHHEQPFHEAVFTHASTSPNQQIIASLDVARRQMELEGYELVMHAIALAIEIRNDVNNHPLLSKYFRVLTPAEMVPAEFRPSGFTSYTAPDVTWAQALDSFRQDEFVLDPTRLTLVCGTAGYDGTQFKKLLADEYELQLNKTSRNSVLLQTNINNTRSDVANLLRVLVEIAKKIDDSPCKGRCRSAGAVPTIASSP